METEVIMPSATGNEEIHIGLRVAEGLGDVSLNTFYLPLRMS